MRSWWWFGERRARLADPASSDALGGDAPIRSATEDLLQRGPLARRIAEIIATPYPSGGRVFAIRADWGVGKSSLKNLVIETLKERNTSERWLEFNPWQWGDNATISRALFLQIAGKLDGRLSLDALRRARLMRRYGKVLAGASAAKSSIESHQATLLTWLGVIAASGFLGLQAPPWLSAFDIDAKEALGWVLGLLVGAALLGRALTWAGQDQTAGSLDELREDLEGRLKKLRGPLIVFVDDIDRLEPEQIRLMIRQVKANANLPNIAFVLLFQPGIIEAALDPISGGAGAGAEYLEKIVQANFDLPVPSREALQQAFTTELQTLIGALATEANGFQQVRWGNVLIGGILPFLSTLRDTRRLLSSIAIHTPLHQGEKAFEVNVIDLVGLETLRVFEPAVHAAIASKKALMLQSSRFSGDDASARNKADIEAVLALASPAHNATVQDLVLELFPTISGPLRNHYYDGGWRAGWVKEKRVCTDRMFDRYFDLQVRAGDISESDFQSFIDASGDAELIARAVTALKADGLLPSLATRLDEGVEQLPVENTGVLLATLFELGRETLAKSNDSWNSAYISCWRAASRLLRRVADRTARAQLMEAAMTVVDALSVPAMLLSLDADRREKGDVVDLLFDDADFARLKALWVSRIKARVAREPMGLDPEDLVSYLYRWRDFAGSFDEPRAYVQQRTRDVEGLLRVLHQFVAVGSVHAMGDRVSARTESFQRKTLEDFFRLADLEVRVSSLDPAVLSDNDARMVAVLQRHFRAWSKGEVSDEA